MKIRFNYKRNTEYYLTISSNMTIVGKGIWEVDEEDLSFIYDKSFVNPLECIKSYFWEELDVDPDFITFNEDDIKYLTNYLENEVNKP